MADTNNTKETLESLGALKYKALQALAKNRGIKANLSKNQLIQELLSAQAQEQQANTTETPADLDLGDATVAGDAAVDADAAGGGDGAGGVDGDVDGAGDGDDKSQDKPQDGALGDDGDDDGGDGGGGGSDTTDKPGGESQDKPEDGSQQPQHDSTELQDDCKEPIAVCDEPQDESCHFVDAMDAGQSADLTSQAGPKETEQQQHEEQQQRQQEEEQEQEQMEEEQQQEQQEEEQQQQQPEEQQQQPEVQQPEVQQQQQQVEPEGSERRRSERLVVANMEKKSVTVAPRKIQSPKFVTKRPAACPSSRFELAHQNMFALQPSIERYGKTPKKTPKKTAAETDASKGKVPAVRQAVSKAKTPASKANAPAGTPARPLEAVFGSGMKSAKRGLTVASKPCTLVVQRSNKKPTQVKEFRLSSNPSMREAFTFKPYSGPVRPMTSGGGALADKTSGFNVGPSGAGHGSQNASKKAFHPLEPLGIKATLASGRAQAARRTAHAQSGKDHREKKLTEARAGRP